MSVVPASKRLRQGIIQLLAVLGLSILAAWVCQVRMGDLIRGFGKGVELFGLFFPPAWKSAGHLVAPALVTVALAFIATPIGALTALPVGLAGARNLSPRWLSLSARLLLGLERGLPEIVILLFLVIIFGLGPLPAALSLAVSSVGMLGKLVADAIEEVPAAAIDAVACVGASQWNVIRYAVIPEVLPSFAANTLFRFEFNIRSSVLLGAAGAGGIGFELVMAMNSLDYQRAAIAILMLICLTFAAERGADLLRKSLLAGAVTR
jgi:phosphonate transport system permease protein